MYGPAPITTFSPKLFFTQIAVFDVLLATINMRDLLQSFDQFNIMTNLGRPL